MQQLLQEVNSARLKLSANERNGKVENRFAAFHLLDYATFAYKDKHYYPLGQMPSWIKELPGSAILDNDCLDLVEFFPFIEVFQYEAADCWEIQLMEKWNQESGRKKHLQADKCF